MIALDDGEYDGLVVDAQPSRDGFDIDITITAGAHKGDVVSLHARLARDPIALLGLPVRLVVAGGAPTLQFDV